MSSWTADWSPATCTLMTNRRPQRREGDLQALPARLRRGGEAPITKGPGGLYPHHRGIFIGWMKMKFDGKSYDRWHMKGGEIVHQKFLAQKAGLPDEAMCTSLIHWNEPDGKAFLVEERTMTFRRGPELRAAWRSTSILRSAALAAT